MVTRELSTRLESAFEKFARDSGFDEQHKVGIFLRPGIFGHHKVGRAADIYAVAGAGLDVWKKCWDEAHRKAFCRLDKNSRNLILSIECRRNIGWRLYKALQNYGQWSQPRGYPIQLFGPWTRTEGPWKPISDFLLNAHRDHIHVAK